MFNFYLNAIKNHKTAERFNRILDSARRCQSLSEREYIMLLSAARYEWCGQGKLK